MKEEIVQWVDAYLPAPVATVALATLPILELRGALPYAILIGKLPVGEAYPLAVLGNMIPIPFILYLLGPVTDLIRKWGPGDRFVEWLFARTRRKGAKIERYEFWGLVMFVAIPLPVTGAWTGSMAAHLFGLGKVKSFVACLLGVCVAGVVMTILSVVANDLFRRLFGLE